MIIFNTTLHIDDSIHDECIEYLRNIYIPKALSSNLIISPSLSRIEKQYEDSGVSYALQFKADDKEILNKWAEITGEILQQELVDKYGQKVTGFVTLLEEIPLNNQ